MRINVGLAFAVISTALASCGGNEEVIAPLGGQGTGGSRATNSSSGGASSADPGRNGGTSSGSGGASAKNSSSTKGGKKTNSGGADNQGGTDDTSEDDDEESGGSDSESGGSDGDSGGSDSETGGATATSRGGATGTLGGNTPTNGGTATSQGGAANGAGVSNASQGGSTTAMGGRTGSGNTVVSNCVDTVPPGQSTTCAQWKEWGQCSSSWFTSGNFCAATCGNCSGGGTPAGGSGNGGSANPGSGGTNTPSGTGGYTGGGEEPPRINGGNKGWASRYWDCCKPACAWKENVKSGGPMNACTQQGEPLTDPAATNACTGGPSYMCMNYAPWAVSDTLAYGYAAASGNNYQCGKCFQLQFDGGSHNGSGDPGSQSLSRKTLIVQIINNGGVGADQFDILVPGGGVGDFDACSKQWGITDQGERYGGFFLACQKQNNFDHAAAKSCTKTKCQAAFSAKPDLMAGCDWFLEWFNGPDNPSLVFAPIACPAAITGKSGMNG